MIHVAIDTTTCRNNLNTIAAKQIPYAASQALNTTAFKVKADEVQALHDHLDRPTPFTQRAYEVRKATRAMLTARVQARPRQAAYLKWQVDGGTERPKKRAIVLPRDIGTNAYGNMTGGAIKAALKRPDVFSGRPGRGLSGPAGIWRRMKGRGKGNAQLRLLVSYTDKAQYKPLLPFGEVARGTVARVFNDEFRVEFASAMASARL